MVRIVLGLDVVINECRRIDVVHHQIELAIAIEVGVRGAVRKARLFQPPLFRLVGECQVAVVAEQVIGLFPRVDVLEQLPRAFFVSLPPCAARGALVIQVVHRLGITIADEDVLETIIVEVGKEGAPAPIRGGYAGHACDVAEDDIALLRDAVVQLKDVDVEVVAKSALAVLQNVIEGRESAHPLSMTHVWRHHVHLHDVGPPVVIEIRDVHAHARNAGMLQPLGGLVRERAVPVVDIQDVIGRPVVGDVDVGPAISIQVSNGHAESVPGLIQDTSLLRHVGEGSMAGIPVQHVVTARGFPTHARRMRRNVSPGKILR